MARTYDANGCITSCKADFSGLEACDRPATHHVELDGYGRLTGAHVSRGLTGSVVSGARGGYCKAHADAIAAGVNARVERSA